MDEFASPPAVVVPPGGLHTYRALNVRPVLGHIIEVDVDLGFDCVLRNLTLQLFGIRELEDGRTPSGAALYLKELMGNAEQVGQLWVRTLRVRGPLGPPHYEATLFARGVNLNAKMVADGHARHDFTCLALLSKYAPG